MTVLRTNLVVIAVVGAALAAPLHATAASADSVVGDGVVSFVLPPVSGLDPLTELLFRPWISCGQGSFSVSATSGPEGENATGTMSLDVCGSEARAAVECLSVHGAHAAVAGVVESGNNYLDAGTRIAFSVDDAGQTGDMLGIAAGGCDAVPVITVVIGGGDVVVVDGEGQDLVAPTITVPAGSTIEATSSAGATVTYAVTASDDHDSAPTLTCDPASGSTFALGTTTVSCSATDAAGNTSSAVFAITVVDTTEPTLVLPVSLALNASSPAGAIVVFTPLATDAVDPSPVVSCSPAGGTLFPVGNTQVTCTTVDASGNRTAPETFNVHVSAGTEQIADLVAAVRALDARQGVVASLDAKLQNVLDALNSAKVGDRASACRKLDAFVSEVQAQTGKALAQSDADRLIADARRIEAVIGCD